MKFIFIIGIKNMDKTTSDIVDELNFAVIIKSRVNTK